MRFSIKDNQCHHRTDCTVSPLKTFSCGLASIVQQFEFRPDLPRFQTSAPGRVLWDLSSVYEPFPINTTVSNLFKGLLPPPSIHLSYDTRSCPTVILCKSVQFGLWHSSYPLESVFFFFPSETERWLSFQRLPVDPGTATLPQDQGRW